MKKQLFSLILLFLTLGLSISFAQDKDTQSLEEAVEELRQLLIKPDQQGLENITAEELSYGHSAGRVEDQKEFIDFLLSGKSQFVSIDLEDQTVDIIGKTAIVRHTLLAETNNEGVKGIIKLGVLMVWQKDGKNWKLLARQAFKM